MLHDAECRFGFTSLQQKQANDLLDAPATRPGDWERAEERDMDDAEDDGPEPSAAPEPTLLDRNLPEAPRPELQAPPPPKPADEGALALEQHRNRVARLMEGCQPPAPS